MAGADSLLLPKATDGRPAKGRFAPVWAGLALLAVIATVIGIGSRRTDGRLIYILDDAYIHMSIARNLANGDTWGINPGEFAGASSSPLWTLLIAGCFRVVGPRDEIPLAINLLAAAGAMAGVWAFLRRFVVDRRLAGLLLFAIGMALPLPMLVMAGMEHTLQIALVFGFVLASLDAVEGKEDSRRLALGAALAALLIATRFDDLFLVFAACSLLALRGRWKAAVLWGACAWVPVGLYGAYSIHHGGSVFPNSVLIKAGTPPAFAVAAIFHFIIDGLRKILLTGPMAGLVLSAAGLLAWIGHGRDHGAREARFLLWLFLLTAVLHGQCAAVGWFSRYEAYLVGLGAAAVCAAVACAMRADGRHRLQPWVLSAAAGVAALPLGGRAFVTLYRDCIAPGNIYQQQCHLAFFVREHYAGKAVAANDIGAISWYGRARVVDLWGLASRDVFQARRAGRYTPDVMRRVCDERGVEMAAVYTDWFRTFGGLPREWHKAGAWTIPHNVAAAEASVDVYSTGGADPSRVAQDLLDFSKRLPPGVRWTVENSN